MRAHHSVYVFALPGQLGSQERLRRKFMYFSGNLYGVGFACEACQNSHCVRIYARHRLSQLAHFVVDASGWRHASIGGGRLIFHEPPSLKKCRLSVTVTRKLTSRKK